MAKSNHFAEPVVIELGNCGRFEVVYRRVKGDEGPVANYFGFVDGEWIKLISFACLQNNPHYKYHRSGSGTPQGKEYSIDRAISGNPYEYLFYSVMQYLTEMVKKCGQPNLAAQLGRIRDSSYFNNQIRNVYDAVLALRRKERRKSKKPKKAKGS